MKKGICLALVVSAIWGGGCASRQNSGSLGDFLLVKIKTNGGKVTPSHPPPSLVGEWEYSDEKFGTVIKSDVVTLEQVDHFLRRIYGPPSKGGKTAAGDIQWVVPARTAGVSIWYFKMGKGIEIDILKPIKITQGMANEIANIVRSEQNSNELSGVSANTNNPPIETNQK